MAFVPVYILILGATIVVDYFAGILIENSEGKRRKNYLLLSLVANIGVLVVFKYYNFLNTNLTFLLGSVNLNNHIPYLSILLPIGLSFHTFQAMSYTIEVYRGNQKAERHFGIYALYVMFYPQLVAGPIERPQNVIHQFYEKHYFDYDRVVSGLKLMVWGMFKKVVIADRLSIMVNAVYGNPTQYEGPSLVLATVMFAFQIFCDFSGYSDIAIGAAQVMGFDLMKNFDRPYFSKTISEFWRRWHISLSTWFRDYLYIPLGGNRVSKSRQYFNLFITFMISGVWHGASWNFIIWGSLHGFYLIFAQITETTRNKVVDFLHLRNFSFLYKILQILVVFILVDFAWIFFAAHSFGDAMYIIQHLFDGWDGFFSNIRDKDFVRKFIFLGESKQLFLLVFVAIILMEVVHIFQRNASLRQKIAALATWQRWVLYVSILTAIIFLGAFDAPSQFIYFQF
jgi:alginate O-acetyltransferase complex protein AlgI